MAAAELRPLTEVDVGTLAVRCRAVFEADYALALGPFPPLDALPGGPPPVQLAVADSTAVHRHPTPFAGHPEMLLARTVKEALNFLRLTLLGLNRRRQPTSSAPDPA